MELSQPRPYGAVAAAEGGRKATHDFLSLYSAQQDPRPNSQGFSLKTHDFLQPLERVGKGCAKEEISSENAAGENPSPAPVEHVLPGGIGTYSISHIPYFSPIRAPKPEGSSNSRNDENSNGSSYTGSGFTLWEESATKKGKTGKENMRDKSAVIEATTSRGGQWGSSAERPTQSSSNNHHGSFSSLSSSQPSRQRSKSLMEMIKCAKGSNALEDEFEEDHDHFLLKKEISSATTNELRVRVDGKSSDQKANTPRSKHSATEQRRRSKINDRFQMLRDLIPHGDQKRDKASFLLEVIEYIQFLQDKVQKYEGPFQGWNGEQTKLMPWKNNRNIGEDFDRSQAMNGSTAAPGVLAFPTKVEDDEPLLVSQNTVVSEALTAQKGTSFAVSSVEARLLSQGALSRLLSDVENATTSHRQTRSCTTVDGGVAVEKLKEEEITIEGGSISISTAYSQGLLRTLTQALQSSGVDLSQASISVQIELGKRADANSLTKDNGILPSNQNAKHCRAANADDPSEQAQKKLKTSKN